MEKLKKCRICLVENVPMIVVADKNLQDVYEKLTDVPFVTEDSKPMLACFLCCSKLKQCYQLQRKCLEAEELFAQILNDDHKTKPLINQGQIEFRSGFSITPTVHLSIVDECQTESIAIKKELPALCDGLDDIIEPKEEHQSYEIELENVDNSCLDVADVLVPPYHSESDLEDNVPLMEIKIEVEEEEEEVSKKNPRGMELKKTITIKEELPDVCEEPDDIIEPKEEQQIYEPEPEHSDNSCLDAANFLVPLYHSESDLEDEVPLMEFKTEVEVELEVSKKKHRAGETKRATVAKKPKLDIRRTKLEDAITAEQTKKEKSDSKVIRTTQKRTSKPGAYFKEPYKCDQRSFRPKGDLTKHIHEKPYKCDVCQRSFSVKCSLFRHIRLHTGEKPYKCDLCQRSFTNQSLLISHIRIHTGEKPFKCDICQCSFRQNGHLTEHIRIHTGEKPYKCEQCQRTFSNRSRLTEHTRIHTGEKPYKCDVCQSSFSYKRNLTQHIRIHTVAKLYKCYVCQLSFSENDHLSEHILIHTGERPYKCDVCQRSFSKTGNLTKHIRIHEKPYKCDVCQRSFSFKGELIKHIRVHTGEKPFKCDKCERSFSQNCHLKRHRLHLHTS